MEARHYKYTWTENTDQAVRACNMTAGKIDLMVTTAGQYLKHRPAGKLVGMIDESAGADALVFDTVKYPYLKTMGQVQKLVRDFKAKGHQPVLAFAGDSPSEELLTELSNISEELKLSDFKLVPVADSPAAFAMLQKGEAQLAIVWEPDTSAARTSGYTVALSSKNVPRRILDVIVASDRLIKNNPAAVQAFVTEFYKARKWDVTHPSKYLAAIADDGKMKPEEAQTVLGGIHLYDAQESDLFLNQRAYPYDEVPIWESLSAITSIDALKDPSAKGQRKHVERHVLAPGCARREVTKNEAAEFS